MNLVFGNIGVPVEGYTKESLYDLLIANELEGLIDKRILIASKPFTEDSFLQAECPGTFKEGAAIIVYKDFIRYITDIDNFLCILRVGILDPDAANSLVDELYSQGLIKPRNES